MREEDAIYGGEMSAHHSFRDFAYCDSGMIPWLLVTELPLPERSDPGRAGARPYGGLPGKWRDQQQTGTAG